MKRILVSAALGVVLGMPMSAWAGPLEEILTDVVNSKGVATEALIESNGARAADGSAAANNGSHAFVDNSIFLKDSALSRNEMKGTISGNSILMENGSDFQGINNIDDVAFKDARGVSQVSQNSGQNSLVQQNFSIQGNVKVDRRISP